MPVLGSSLIYRPLLSALNGDILPPIVFELAFLVFYLVCDVDLVMLLELLEPLFVFSSSKSVICSIYISRNDIVTLN